jgi:uncharacterized tannase-like protein DUF6351
MAAMLLDLINHWLDNMAAGPSPLTMEKVVSNKPPSAADTCWDLSGNKNGAGHPVQHDLSSLQSPAATGWTGVDQISLEVHLKPINFKDYEVIFTPSERSSVAELLPAWRMLLLQARRWRAANLRHVLKL